MRRLRFVLLILIFSCQLPRAIYTGSGYQLSPLDKKFTFRNEPPQTDTVFAPAITVFYKQCASGRETRDALVFFPDGRMARVWLNTSRRMNGDAGYYRRQGNLLQMQLSSGDDRGFFIGHTCDVWKGKGRLSGDTIRIHDKWFYDEGNTRIRKGEGCYFIRDTFRSYMFMPPDW